MLEELKNKREELSKKLNSDLSQIKILEADEKIINYKELLIEAKKNKEQLEELDFELDKEKMSSCSHIFITSKIDKIWDGHRTDKYEYHSCIKCGLDTRYRSSDYMTSWTPLTMAMEEIFKKTRNNGIWLKDTSCHIDLAMAIYNGIKKAYPDISDEKAAVYFKASLNSIRTKEVTENVEKSRIKRLELQPSFKCWKVSSIISDYNGL
jgi:hypothetical protein